jgi:uncharacterized protein (DUF2141 family)
MILTIFLSSTVHAQTGTLAVKVTQVDVKEGGMIKIGIYDSKSFPFVGKEVAGIDIEVKGTSATYVFKNIPAGKYAIAVFQDSNGDGKLNKNMFGVPKEPYGFSNNKYGKFGPPDFEDVSFDVKEDTSISLTINLK